MLCGRKNEQEEERKKRGLAKRGKKRGKKKYHEVGTGRMGGFRGSRGVEQQLRAQTGVTELRKCEAKGGGKRRRRSV